MTTGRPVTRPVPGGGERGALVVIATGILALSTPAVTQVVWLLAVVGVVVFARAARREPTDRTADPPSAADA